MIEACKSDRPISNTRQAVNRLKNIAATLDDTYATMAARLNEVTDTTHPENKIPTGDRPMSPGCDLACELNEVGNSFDDMIEKFKTLSELIDI